MKKIVLLLLSITSNQVFSGSFVFAGEQNGINRITHPPGFSTTNVAVLNVNVCLDPASSVTAPLELPVRNVINTWNNLQMTSSNIKLGASNNIPSGDLDWESVVLHEVGHCIGLAHPNLGGQTGVTGANTDYTITTDGANNTFAFGAGADGLIGSNDDSRGDDVNLHWFNKGINNPFIASPPYDSTNYSRLVSDLPSGHSFVANADRDVAVSLGFNDSEAVMQQGTYSDEDQRTLGVDDVATVRIAMSGLDEIQGTADDYRINLNYLGVSNSSNCDINIKHDVSYGGLAVCELGGNFVGSHVVITSANIRIGTSFNWFFNTIDSSDIIFKNGFE